MFIAFALAIFALFALIVAAPIKNDAGMTAEKSLPAALIDFVDVKLNNVVLRVPFQIGVTLVFPNNESFISKMLGERPPGKSDQQLSDYIKANPGPVALQSVRIEFNGFCKSPYKLAICGVQEPGVYPLFMAVDVVHLPRATAQDLNNGAASPDFAQPHPHKAGLQAAILKSEDGSEFDCLDKQGPGLCSLRVTIGPRVVATLRLLDKRTEIGTGMTGPAKAAFKEAFLKSLKKMN